MNHPTRSLLAVLLGVLLFDFLFWQEKMGVNCLLFALFFVTALAVLFPENRFSRPFLWTAGGTILTAAMIAWHNSGAAKFAFMLSAMTAAGFAQATGFRFVLHAFLQYLGNFSIVPGKIVRGLRSKSGENPTQKGRKNWRTWVGLSFVPALVVCVFYLIYYLANEKFAALSDSFWGQIGRWLSFDISLAHVFFVIFAIFVVGAGFFRRIFPILEKKKEAADFLTRVRLAPTKSRIARNWLVGLAREYRQSLVLLGLLNALLLLVNLTDIVYVWFGFEEMSATALKQYVHEGTYFLIASILLAMFVTFRIFRKNLNFYPKNTLLKQLSLAWLIQNGILACSVAVRNWRYIDNYALAYKRIGVFLFLILVAVGLLTLWLKIRDRRSLSWLWRQNSWAFYALLIGNALVPWDTFITRHNLAFPPKSGIDIGFLIFDVSDKNLRILEENKAILVEKQNGTQISADRIESALNEKRAQFERAQNGLSWKSWNAADAANK